MAVETEDLAVVDDPADDVNRSIVQNRITNENVRIILKAFKDAKEILVLDIIFVGIISGIETLLQLKCPTCPTLSDAKQHADLMQTVTHLVKMSNDSTLTTFLIWDTAFETGIVPLTCPHFMWRRVFCVTI